MFDFRCVIGASAAALLLLFTLLLTGIGTAARAETQRVSVAELDQMMARGVTIIDVRRIDEWRATGIVPGSRTITAFDSKGELDPAFIEAVAATLPRDQPVALICRSGNRSAIAAQLLSERLGFQRIYDVDGGIQAWLRERRPVTACPSC